MLPLEEDVRRELDKDDELDYLALANDLGPDAIPALDLLVKEDEPRMAASAVYLAGLIAVRLSPKVAAKAAASDHAVVRVAAAAALAPLAARDVTAIAHKLLGDDDTGVRARAVRSSPWFDDEAIAERVRVIAREDPEPALRELAASLVRPPPDSAR